MKRHLLILFCGSLLLFGFGEPVRAQADREKPSPETNDKGAKIVALNTNQLAPLEYDAGKIKFIATSEDTNGASAVVELTEMPGYKTAWHRHNHCEEAFYVAEGTLTIKIMEKTYEMPAGSYILIPRGTPHGQGNFTDKPVRLLTTFTPGGFDIFFKDRVELFKTVKPGDEAFKKRFDELREKHKKWVEILGTWDIKK